MSSGSRSTSFSVSTSRDMLWECALSALPDALLSALRAAELDDPRVLSEYPRGRLTDLETLGRYFVGTASFYVGQFLCCYSTEVLEYVCWWFGGICAACGRRNENRPSDV